MLRAKILPVSVYTAVTWIERREVFEYFNNQASAVVQSTDSSTREIWNRGLMGEGQVIGFADSVSHELVLPVQFQHKWSALFKIL